MSNLRPNPSSSDADRRAAADWVARADRGLKASEQDDYLQWLRENPERAALITEHEQTLKRLMGLSQWQPGANSEPHSDLFGRHPRWPRYALMFAAAAAATIASLLLLDHSHWSSGNSIPSHLVVDEQRTLTDGSRIEFKDGSAVDVRYNPAERRVALLGGEAIFTVAKNPARPFIVDANGTLVKAVGTVFDVRADAYQVRVLVTEGKVQVDRANEGAGQGPLFVSAGECAFIPVSGATAGAKLTRVSASEVDADLSWRAPQFQFFETPLQDAVADFNRHNKAKLLIADPEINSWLVGGTFRADDVEGFARIMEKIRDVRSTPDSRGGYILTRAH